jgi:L-ascorbate metabolism protein UlaG (beta-lactamase superfamily)
MKLKWYGHASFRITSSAGASVITDPYDPRTSGYKPYIEPADVVVISSDNDSFHCNEHLVPGAHVTVNALELARGSKVRTEHGVVIRAIQAMEAERHRDYHPDQNGMYVLELDGLRVGHMGDVGNPFTLEQLEFFKGVDVLLALAGGFPTIELSDLKAVIDYARPKLVVPMHFRTLTYKPRSQLWIQTFLDLFDDAQVDFACASEVEIRAGNLPASTRVLVVDYV